MSKIIRFGVSLEASLLQTFDDLIKKMGYSTHIHIDHHNCLEVIILKGY